MAVPGAQPVALAEVAGDRALATADRDVAGVGHGQRADRVDGPVELAGRQRGPRCGRRRRRWRDRVVRNAATSVRPGLVADGRGASSRRTAGRGRRCVPVEVSHSRGAAGCRPSGRGCHRPGARPGRPLRPRPGGVAPSAAVTSSRSPCTRACAPLAASYADGPPAGAISVRPTSSVIGSSCQMETDGPQPALATVVPSADMATAWAFVSSATDTCCRTERVPDVERPSDRHHPAARRRRAGAAPGDGVDGLGDGDHPLRGATGPRWRGGRRPWRRSDRSDRPR